MPKSMGNGNALQKLMAQSALDALMTAGLPRESFGPDSPHPFIAFEISGGAFSNPSALQDLPCPVIGIGRGPAAALCDVALEDTRKLGAITRNIEEYPIAAMTLVQHLRLSETLSLKDALTAESLAYGTLQTGPEFQNWLAAYERPHIRTPTAPPLDIQTSESELSITLTRPDTRNAIDVEMRDALCEALDLALMDISLSKVSLTGQGAAFSTGGEVAEFGTISDPATAHWIRTLRLPAWRLARLTGRLHVHVNGAAIGAGAEIAAFGAHITASEKAWFQLPELKYGLIPGAGGTASLPRKIGRPKTAYMALSMDRISAAKALEWGLVDEIK